MDSTAAAVQAQASAQGQPQCPRRWYPPPPKKKHTKTHHHHHTPLPPTHTRRAYARAHQGTHTPEDGAQPQELRVKRVVKGLQRLGVLGVGDEPVDRGEVLALRELLVQAPEHLRCARGVCGARPACLPPRPTACAAHCVAHLPTTHTRPQGALTHSVAVWFMTQRAVCVHTRHLTRAHLHDGERGRRDRVAEVAAWGRHRAHDGHTALTLWRAQAVDAARALVEGRQAVWLV
jgi:hypothetical protein